MTESLDLLVRARRESLAEKEEQELEELLLASAEARWLLDVGLTFDRETAEEAGDAERIARLARRVELSCVAERGEPAAAIARTRQRTTRTRRKRLGFVGRLKRAARSLPLVAATLCFACGALAGLAGAATVFRVLGVTSSSKPPSSPQTTSLSTPRARTANAKRTAESAPSATLEGSQPKPAQGSEAPAPAQNAAPISGTAQRAHVRPIETPPKPAPPPALGASRSAPTSALEASAVPASAAGLYARANQARQQNRWDEAVALYTELQLREPLSEQARASHLALGNLYLLQNRASPALEQFRRHQQSAGSAFRAEALWGEAKALARLGRSAEEHAAFARLLTEYPGSPYETAARRRLQEE